MHKLLALAALGVASLLAPTGAQAGVDVGIAIGVPFYGAPYYYAPAPVWRGPAVVYHEHYVPRSYYSAPPRPYYDGRYYRGYRDGYRDREWRGRGRGHDRHHHDHHHEHGHRRHH